MAKHSRTAYYLVAGLVAAGLPRSSAQAPGAEPGSSITLLALNQPPCTVPTASSVLKMKLAYHLAPTEQSEFGFAVSIKFQTTDPHRTFSSGRFGQASISRRSDTLTLTYPLAAVWQAPQLQRPVQCYLYLHRNTTGTGRSTVIAKTPAIVLQACP